MSENRASEHNIGYQSQSWSGMADPSRALGPPSAIGPDPIRRFPLHQVLCPLLWLLALMVLPASMVHATNYTGSITISPEHPSDNWPTGGGQSLQPLESATLMITIIQSGYVNDYEYQRQGDVVTEWTTNYPNFIWSQTPAGPGGGTFSICNTASTSAWALVTVSCVWKPVLPTGGGGGQAWVPPNIPGMASGAAVAQPGDYYNLANTNIIRIGETTVAKAYCDEELSASTWSTGGDKLRFLTGGGEATSVSGVHTVTVKGKQASDGEFDAVISSSCECGCGKSDTEPFTVVAVKSITAEPDIVPVGFTNIFYTIATQPTGHSDLVSYTPADTSTPGIKEIIAICGSSAATCTVTVLKMDMNLPQRFWPDSYPVGTIFHYDFNDATPGVCAIRCEARTNPDNAEIQQFLEGKIHWSIEEIEGSQLSWEYGGVAQYGTSSYWWDLARYTGLPENNSAFGEKTASFTVTGLGCQRQGKAKIFFRRDVTNHPGEGAGTTPNWYYYWSQTDAGQGYTYQYDAGSEKSEMKYINNAWRCIIRAHAIGPFFLHNVKTNMDYSYENINAFAHIVRHEERHRLDFIDMWGDGGGSPTSPYVDYLDTDRDGLKDSMEATLVSGREYDPNKKVTFPDEWNYGVGFDDAEDLCLWRQEWPESTAYDGVDWANPGRQYWPGYTSP